MDKANLSAIPTFANEESRHVRYEGDDDGDKGMRKLGDHTTFHGLDAVDVVGVHYPRKYHSLIIINK